MFLALVFVFELIAVALAVAAWMINQTLDEQDYSSENDGLIFHSLSAITSTTPYLGPRQSTDNQKKPVAFGSLGGSSTDEKEAVLTPRSVLDDQFPYLNESLEESDNFPNNFEWDSAFYTSAGVLDPEELSCLINGDDQGELQISPGIKEDVWKSTDSIFTLGSDDLILKKLEAELFEDIKVSQEKSSKPFTCEAFFCESQVISCEFSTTPLVKKKTNLSSQNQKQQPAFKKPKGTSKSLTHQTLGIQGTARAAKQDAVYTQLQQPVIRCGDSNLTFPKRPRVIKSGKSTPTITAKRASFASYEANKIKHVADRGSHTLKKPVVSGAHRVLTKPTSSSKASSFDSLISIQSPAFSLTDGSGSVGSGQLCKSHLLTIRRNFGERNVGSPSFGSTFKTPSKSTTRNMISSGNSASPEYLMFSKITPSISPDSSISEWSSSPSSSTSLDTSSCRSSGYGSINSAFNDHYNSQRLDNHNFSSVNDAVILNSSSPLTSTVASLQHYQIRGNQEKPDLLESRGGSIGNVKEASLTPSADHDDCLPCLNKSLEPDGTERKAKNDLHKSLEWDSAFFTSAGVLDPEELSCLINGAKLSEKQTLPEYEMIGTSDLNDHISCLLLNNQENEGMATLNGSVGKSSAQAEPSSPWASACPSALRMPSRKFGFFDW